MKSNRHFLHLSISFIVIAMLLPLCSCRNTRGGKTVVVGNDQYFAIVKPYLKNGYDVIMVPKGISMLPTIGDNTDLVTLHADSVAKPNDIVLVQMKSGQYVMHRVVKIEGGRITLKGDNNKSVEHTGKQNILARVIAHQKGGAMVKDTIMADRNASYKMTPHLRLDQCEAGKVVVDTLKHVVYMQRVVSMNEAAQMLWDKFQGQKFSVSDMAKAITDIYDVDMANAESDCMQLVNSWLQCALVYKVE